MKADVRTELVTPKKAEQWINTNKGNRKMRDGVAEKYADDMRNGRWTTCPAPIAFYEDDDLADGQHRLWAIIDSGVSIEFIIMRGLKREDGLNIDTGLPRNLIDNARISGKDADLSNELLSYARAVEQGHQGAKGPVLSNTERLELVNKHRDAVTWAIRNGPNGRGLRNAAVMGALSRAWYWETDKDRLRRFGDVFKTGLYDGDGETAAIALRNYFMVKKGLLTSAMWTDTFMKAQNAISYFMKGRKLTVIKNVSEEAYPLKKVKKASK